MDRTKQDRISIDPVSYTHLIAPTMRLRGYKRIDSTERTVVFAFGEVTFSRNRWRKGKKSCYPVDEWLGLEKYMRYSPELIFHMAKHASVLSYREVCRTVKTVSYTHLDVYKRQTFISSTLRSVRK